MKCRKVRNHPPTCCITIEKARKGSKDVNWIEVPLNGFQTLRGVHFHEWIVQSTLARDNKVQTFPLDIGKWGKETFANKSRVRRDYLPLNIANYNGQIKTWPGYSSKDLPRPFNNAHFLTKSCTLYKLLRSFLSGHELCYKLWTRRKSVYEQLTVHVVKCSLFSVLWYDFMNKTNNVVSFVTTTQRFLILNYTLSAEFSLFGR